ncbi:uncharacterized protein LOC124387240 [Silurus meridionalis]|uniref:uncharacterized protein LOC124387240 n=1 Tax=Silurus meridionalis TaxID=175797 RepID=UPI001EEB8287|nr:uncharacterized protein LOC124387240 [Silurus meridionalis]
MPWFKETLTGYLSPGVASSLSPLTLPIKPLPTKLALVGRAYTSAGQAAGYLHTMYVVQAHQADLLRDLDVGCGWPDTRATKETSKAFGWSMAALTTTERHLWLTQIEIPDRDKAVLLVAPLLPSGLFSHTISSVVERFQEAKKQSPPFQQYLPCCPQWGGLVGAAPTSTQHFLMASAETKCHNALFCLCVIRAAPWAKALCSDRSEDCHLRRGALAKRSSLDLWRG